MVWFCYSGDVEMVWFWFLGRCWDGMVLFPRETLRWYGFDSSGGVEMVWFWFLGRRLVWFWNLGRCKRLRDLISEKIVWFGFLGRRRYDLAPSGEVVYWWPPSGDVKIPWPGYPTITKSRYFTPPEGFSSSGDVWYDSGEVVSTREA